MQFETAEKIKQDYETLMRDFNNSKTAAEDALKVAKEREKETGYYELNDGEYKNISDYYQKILKLKDLSEYIKFHFNKGLDEKHNQLFIKWKGEFESYQDEADDNGILDAYLNKPLKQEVGGGKTKKKRKQRSDKTKKKRKQRSDKSKKKRKQRSNKSKKKRKRGRGKKSKKRSRKY